NRFLDKVIYVSSSCNCHDRSCGFPRLEPDKLHLQSSLAFPLWSVVGSRTDNDVKNYWNTDLKKKKKKKKKQKKKKQANSIHCP
ncbi:hypothetical protein GW17_00049836, partial [Ensete ventricosum]